MKRYYIAPVIGAGTRENPYSLKIRNYNVPYVAIIPSNADGTPKFAWGIGLVSGTNHTALLADSEIFALPDLSLDGKLSSLTSAQRAALRAKVNELLGNTTWYSPNMGYREVIRGLGQFLLLGFNENNFDVADPT